MTHDKGEWWSLIDTGRYSIVLTALGEQE